MENLATKSEKTVSKSNNVKIPFITKVGYGSGGIAGAIMGDFVTIYFLFFLTNVAGIKPALGGTILLIGTICNAVANPVIGMLCDRPTKNGGSRKRSYLLRSAFLLGIIFSLMFTMINVTPMIRVGIYIALCISFYFVYATYEVPYYAIAANLTADNDERTKLRSVVVVVETMGTLILGIIPPSLIDFFQTHGYSKNTTWMYTAIILGVTASIFIFVCWFATKGKELALSEDELEEQEEKMNPKEIIDVLKLKPFLLVAAAAFSFYFYYTMLGNTSYYFMTGNLGLSGTQISFVNAYSIVFNMLTVMACGKVSEKIDKKFVFVFALALSAASYTFFGIFGIKTLMSYVIFCTFDGIQNGAYWTIIYTFLYDIVELDEFKTGKRKEGTVMGFFSLITVAGQALAGQTTGILLQSFGYNADAATQTEKAMHGILKLTTIYPAIAIALSAFFIFIYPINRKRMEALSANMELKRNGEEYTTEGFDMLLK